MEGKKKTHLIGWAHSITISIVQAPFSFVKGQKVGLKVE